jgi:hypothetical protein
MHCCSRQYLSWFDLQSLNRFQLIACKMNNYANAILVKNYTITLMNSSPIQNISIYQLFLFQEDPPRNRRHALPGKWGWGPSIDRAPRSQTTTELFQKKKTADTNFTNTNITPTFPTQKSPSNLLHQLTHTPST